MTRKTYIRIADVLSAEYSIATSDAQRTTVENVTARLADVFAQESQRFDRSRFYLAALGRDSVRAE